MDTMNSGRCRGGPFNTKTAHHHGYEYRVAIDPHDPLRALPGQQGPSENVPEVLFGSYIYQPGLEEWWWDESTVSSSRVRPVSVDKQKDEEAL